MEKEKAMQSWCLWVSAPFSSSLPAPLEQCAHFQAVDVLTPAHSPPAPAALHDLQTPFGPLCFRALLWHSDGEEKMYQQHLIGNPTDPPAAAGSASLWRAETENKSIRSTVGPENSPPLRWKHPVTLLQFGTTFMKTSNAAAVSACQPAAGHRSIQFMTGFVLPRQPLCL